MINFPRLLNQDMAAVGSVQPDSMSITRNLHALSTAKMVLPPGEPVVRARSFLKLFDRYGCAGVYRVSKVRSAYGQQVELSLKHGLCVLEDDTVKVSEGKAAGTAGQIIQTLWNSEGVTQAPLYWRLGSFADTPTIEFEYNNPKLMDAVWEVLEKVPGYALDFDQSVFPWVLNLVKLDEQVSCEGRFGRNLDTCAVSVDDSAFCSRVYLDDRDGYTDSPTAAEWGISSSTLTVPEGADETAVSEYVSAYLREYGEPRVVITLEAADMSAATGEELDAFANGKLCRVCLPDYGVTLNERIVTISIPDVYGNPDHVSITMANRTETASSYLEKLRSSSKTLSNQSNITNRRLGGVGAKLDQTDIELVRTKEELTDTRYRLSKSGLVIDGDAESVKAFAYQETADLLDGRLNIAESELLVQAEQISAKASQYELDALGNRVTTAESELLVQAGQISRKVSKDGVISSINQTAEEIKIQANKINLSGHVTASTFETEIASIENVFAGNSVIGGLGVSGQIMTTDLDVASNMKLFGSYTQWKTLTMGSITGAAYLGRQSESAMDLQHSHAVTVGDDGRVYLGEVSSTGGNFKIADTKAYQDGVSAAYADGKNDWAPVDIERTSYSTADKTVTVRAVNAAGVPLISLEKINASEIYDAGSSAGYNSGHSDGYEDGVLDGWDNGYTDGYDAAKDDATVSISITKFRQTSATKVELEVKAYARINGETVATGTKTQSLTIVLET